MKLIDIINEQVSNSTIYYHGTSSEEAGKKIIEQGIKPGIIKTSNKIGAPVVNRVYLTPDLETAIVYCIGANMIGSDISNLIKKEGRYGYLFGITKQNLTNDIQPDEDTIGYLLQYVYTGKYYGDELKNIKSLNLKWLKYLADSKLSSNQIKNILHNYDDMLLFKMGKKLVKYMTPEEKQMIINAYSNIAHDGNVIPETCWKFDKMLNPKLKKDGSNFFQLAKRIR